MSAIKTLIGAVLVFALVAPALAQPRQDSRRDTSDHPFEFSLQFYNNRVFIIEKFSGCFWSVRLSEAGAWEGEWVLNRGYPEVCDTLFRRAATSVTIIENAR